MGVSCGEGPTDPLSRCAANDWLEPNEVKDTREKIDFLDENDEGDDPLDALPSSWKLTPCFEVGGLSFAEEAARSGAFSPAFSGAALAASCSRRCLRRRR